MLFQLSLDTAVIVIAKCLTISAQKTFCFLLWLFLKICNHCRVNNTILRRKLFSYPLPAFTQISREPTLSLHLLQICLFYVNTLLIQGVLAEPQQFRQIKKEDLRALTPLIYSHVTPYGQFRLDLSERIPIEETLSA